MFRVARLHTKGTTLAALVVAGAAATALGVLDVPAARAGEPSGGRWKPVVLPTSNAVVVPGPVTSWRGLKKETSQLLDYQKNRTAETTATVRYWDRQGVVRWNEIARQLVITYKTPPPLASRVYALLSVAQYDALVAAWNSKYKYNRAAPSRWDVKIKPQVQLEDDPTYPSEDAVIAGASAAVLNYLYPAEAVAIEAKAREHAESRLWAGANFPSDLVAGDKLGRDVAQLVVNRAATDGSNATWTGSIPTGPGMWTGTNPLLPMWGKVRPWLVQNVVALRPPPPPSVDSTEFQIALQEVRWFSDNRTPQQLQIAQFWADGAGTYTPPGHWNEIACNLLNQRNWSALREARTLALMNMAVMDAGICCWDAKYAYWLLRPSQADPAITTPVGLPNFPAYTSGHSTFSGAASEVLGYLFPAQLTQLRVMAEEASMSRVYGGIHFRFDSEVGLGAGRSIARDAGLVSGKKVATLSVARALSDGAPAPTE